MALGDGDIAFAVDLFSDLGSVTIRKMFGGICLYQGGTVFALMSSEGRLYLKSTGDLALEMAGDGAEQFHNMPYWSMPDAALDDPSEACRLARQTLALLS
ncbi:TfoX/Sxy family protein [Yoonia sp. BS5-3]|uniref:TfoX/Sxy family protein n=1 Tax=Yoonia phaeophyticola TaxID=3137369 RepID=A0ABZ2V2Z8_9RHOB